MQSATFEAVCLGQERVNLVYEQLPASLSVGPGPVLDELLAAEAALVKAYAAHYERDGS